MLLMKRRANMAPEVKKHLLSLYVKTLIIFITFLGDFTYSGLVAAIPLNTPEASREIDQAEPFGSAPSRVGIARVQSAAQKIVEEDAMHNKANGAAHPPQPLPKSGGKMKKVKTISGSASDKNEMRQVRDSSAIQEDDSLSSDSGSKSKPSKGKSSGKEDSF